LPPEAVATLPGRLEAFWQRYRFQFWTKTRNVADQAQAYVSGLLRMDKKRTMRGIERQTEAGSGSLQHFMTNSPWDARGVIQQVQQEVAATPALQHETTLILDESADAKAGPHAVGSGRQHNGRLGKVDQCQVGVFLAIAKGTTWTWVDGELFVPEAWFAQDDATQARGKRVGLPEERTFKTKVELGWEMIERVLERGLPFELFACDDQYGRADWFRAKLAQRTVLYIADVPRNTKVYEHRPEWGVPTPKKPMGKRKLLSKVLSAEPSITAVELANRPETAWRTLRVRSTARGELQGTYAACRVWTLRDVQPAEEWLVLRREADGDITYALSNAAADCTLEELARMEAQRYFVERAIQDAKAELGWDEFQALKYRAWEHQLALTILAAWFIAQTRLDWQQQYPADPELQQLLETDELQVLSVANVRELLRATMPLPELTPEKATDLVVEHLLNRTRSRKSRLKKQRAHMRDPSSEPG
jgi:SRSO17 transposase